MLKRFIDGFVFGAGFCLAFLLLAILAGSLIMPMLFRPVGQPVVMERHGIPPVSVAEESSPQFFDLPIEEQIKRSSVIALASYEPSSDGRMRAIIREFLKKDSDTVITYKIGDEFRSGSFYPKEGQGRGDGLIVFFEGKQANLRMSVAYSGDRISGLADIPLELFRKKCGA